MGKIIDKIVQSATEPSKNDLWLHEGSLKANLKGKWESIGGGSGGGVQIVDSVDELNNLNVPNGSIVSVAPLINDIKLSEACIVDFEILNGFINDVNGYQQYINSLIPQMTIIKNIKINAKKYTIEDKPLILFFFKGDSIEDITNNMIGLMLLPSQTGNLNIAAEMQFIDNEGTSIRDACKICEEGVIIEDNLNRFNEILKTNDFKYFMPQIMEGTISIEAINFIDSCISVGNLQSTKAYIKDSFNFVKLMDEQDGKKLETRLDELNSKIITDLTNTNAYTIKPDNYYVINRRSEQELLLTLGEEDEYSYKEYMIEIHQNNYDSTLRIIDSFGNETINWINGAPTLPQGATILISIIHRIGIYIIF